MLELEQELQKEITRVKKRIAYQQRKLWMLEQCMRLPNPQSPRAKKHTKIEQLSLFGT